MITKDKDFKITSVCREDFESRGYDASKLTDAEMERIASKMADAYCECCFWVALDYHAEDRKLPKLKEECPHAKEYQVANNKGGWDIRCRHCDEYISNII